ncbi:hypothetical protein WOLCODRAFT_166057 [Wolfiporia cocos MD-104 SS10]|uniref:Uncharacterized protein n=1 Tax=Wolfiporia cocos (strain MD-104) TaxID=742152 RepID=A0A2H3JEK1_WOLCO|nr:hypothetical protein WOLCODRAFT_166057 [Wolfiporia cocos MD-104 SS10]
MYGTSLRTHHPAYEANAWSGSCSAYLPGPGRRLSITALHSRPEHRALLAASSDSDGATPRPSRRPSHAQGDVEGSAVSPARHTEQLP